MQRRAVVGKPRVITGWRREPPDGRDRMLAYRVAPRAVPPAGDLAAKCPRVEDQGELGSCVGNAAGSLVEFVDRRDGSPPVELSRLAIYYDARVTIGGFAADDDAGCYVRDAMKALAKLGAPVERLWPYVPSRFDDEPDGVARADGATRQVVEYLRCARLADIKQSIADGYPVVGGFDVPESMFTAEVDRTGVVPLPRNDVSGGHAVLFVGYNDATRRLKFQNSWGTGWGQDGFGFLPYEYVERGLADDFWSIRGIERTVPSPPPVPPEPRRPSWWQRFLAWLRG